MTAAFDQQWWLIESRFTGNTAWWNGRPEGAGVNMTTDPNLAVRFGRIEDAERVAQHMHMVKVTGHFWLSSQSKGAAQAPTDEREAFEQWAAQKGWGQEDIRNRSVIPGRYSSMAIQHAWESWSARAVLASRTDGAAASVQKPALGHQIGASAEKPAAVDGGRAGHPTYLLESLTDESGTDHAVSLLWHGKFYSKWSKSAKRAERVAKLLRDEFGFANRDELSTPPNSSDEQGKVGKGVTP